MVRLTRHIADRVRNFWPLQASLSSATHRAPSELRNLAVSAPFSTDRRADLVGAVRARSANTGTLQDALS